jgi:solute carrier family 25 aspartate/glutamate transporter 12/13
MFEQYPFDKDSKRIEVIPKEEDLSRIRARNALKILLDVHSDFANVKRSS